MTALTIYTFWAFGLAYILGRSKLSLAPRTWLFENGSFIIRAIVMLIECPACLGAWIGMIAAQMSICPINHWILAACYTCASNLIIATLLGHMPKEE